MASNLREETVNGQRLAVCENSQGKTFYLYETDVSMEDGRKHIWTWQSKAPGQQDHDLKPAVMPRGFELTETSSEHQPVLRK